MRALVVEDFKLISNMWVKVLEGFGYTTVDVADHSDDVLPAVERTQPELIFMDINLPGSMNGIELTKIIKQRFPEIKVLMLSIHTEPSMIERAFIEGADGYLTKNSPILEIKEAITTVKSGGKFKCKEIQDL